MMQNSGNPNQAIQGNHQQQATKVCRACFYVLSLDFFVKNKALPTGIDSLCLSCNRVRAKIQRDSGKVNRVQEWKKYKEKYPAKVAASWYTNYANRKQRVPSWLSEWDLFLIEEMYSLAQKRTQLTGISWHVDHIIPLQGKTVSGLHTPSNLRIIPATLNLKKSNKYDANGTTHTV